MRFRIQFATALVCTTAVIAIARPSLAQSLSQRGKAPNAAAPLTLTSGEMPAGPMKPSPVSDGGHGQDYIVQSSGDGSGYSSGSYTEGLSAGACCDQSCSPVCGCESGGCGSDSRWFFTADYLYVHPTFSDSTAFIRQDLGAGTDDFIPLDFSYDSSYRFGGGCRLCSCGDEFRFMFTRFSGDASEVALPTDIVPFGADAPPDGRTVINANVDAKTYDLECVKIIPLGGRSGNCGEGCGRSCPAWDLGWSGGIRWADVNWDRSYTALDDTDFAVTDIRSGMKFHGGGIRTGLEGRRYFGCDGWLSLYGKGNVSLLLGDVNIDTVRSSDEGNTVVRQSYNSRQLISMFDMEAGVTAQVTCHTAITAGYLLSAWSDLGFRNSFDICDCDAVTPPLLASKMDDSNTLGFDGLFVRVEFAF
jgi:Legionella pneumophila major outer membrane protein precursor